MAEFRVVDGWTVGQLIQLLRNIPSNARIFVGKEGGGSAAEYSNHVLLMLTQFGNEKRLLIGGIGARVTDEELKNSIQAWAHYSTCNITLHRAGGNRKEEG